MDLENRKPSRRAWHGWVFWPIVATLAFGVVLFFVHTPGIDGLHSAMYGDQVYSESHRPFVLRALTPFVVRNLVALVPDTVRDRLEDLANDRKEPYRHQLIYMGWNPELLPEYFVGMFVMWLALLGFVWAFQGLTRATIETSEKLYRLLPILALVLMPAYFAEYYCYLYDFPVLFLFCLGLYFLATENWIGFFVLYPLSCFNKETTILLTVVYCLHFTNRSSLFTKVYWLRLLYQIAFFLAIRFWLTHHFEDRPGQWQEFHLWRNTSLMQSHTHLFYALFGIWVVLAFTLPHRWNRKPHFLRHAIWIGFILLPLDALYGFLDELRTYYEVYPVALLLVVFTIGERVGWMKAKEPPLNPNEMEKIETIPDSPDALASENP